MIIFKELKFRNIMSYGDTWSTVDFTKSSLTSVRGKNSAGKSTILEALCFVLFGKPFRRINKPMLVNSRNSKGLLVEIDLIVNNVNYRIKRGLLPNLLEIYCNDKLLNQDASIKDYQETLEKNILKIDYQTFNQIVILGKASYTSFMCLTLDQRRKFIENILSLNIFGLMLEIHKENTSKLKADISDFKMNYTILKNKIKSQEETIESIAESGKKINKQYFEHIDQQINQLNSDIDELQGNITTVSSNLEPESDLSELKTSLVEITKLLTKAESKAKTLRKDIKFYHENTVCPTCQQQLTDDFRADKTTAAQDNLTSIIAMESSLTDKLSTVKSTIGYNDSLVKKNVDRKNNIRNLESQIRSKKESIEMLDKSKLITVDNEQSLVHNRQMLKQLQSEFDELLLNKDVLNEKLEMSDVVSFLLSDGGIKKLVIGTFIPIINTSVNNFLHQLNFPAKFTIDNEFNEKINIRGEIVTYQSLSEGEKQKVDLGMMLAWRSVAQIRSKFKTNLLILDEVIDASLDTDSVESFIEILKSMTDINCFIITHSDKYNSAFDGRIQVTKNSKGFSSLNFN